MRREDAAARRLPAAVGRGPARFRTFLASAAALAFLVLQLASIPASAATTESRCSGRGVWAELELEDLAGHRWGAEELLGKVVLIDFWATWCAPCLAQMPHLQALHQRFQGPSGFIAKAEAEARQEGTVTQQDGEEAPFVLLGIALDELPRRDLLSFLRRNDLRWPQVHPLRPWGSPVVKRFQVEAVPATIVVDSCGRWVARDLQGAALEKTLEALLRQREEPRREKKEEGVR
ncbi:MAG: TlpA disulfide reductase family protein [Acidobacteriota bacterium]